MFADSHTLANTQRDFREWHRGRGPYTLWALDLDMSPIRERVIEAARHLDGLLLPDYVRQPHVTLHLCGFSGRPCEVADDEFDPFELQASISSLAQARLEAFTIRIGGPDSFSSAPYLTVEDCDGGIARARQALNVAALHPATADYVPHVTIGLYRDRWPRERVLAQLDAMSLGPPIDCRIERIALMTYDPRVIGGALQLEKVLTLSS